MTDHAAGLNIDGVSFAYGVQEVLSDLRLSVPAGQFISLLGPSGSGKSTLLRLVAGLEAPDEGAIRWLGNKVTAPGIDRGVVFQDYSLYPWMRVEDNVALAVSKGNPDLTAREALQRARGFLSQLGLANAERKYPFELSGGMRQRAAIARALALGSPVLLLDEPFGALDPLNRARLQDLLLELWRTSMPRKTVIFVTHDVDEALYLSERVVVLGSVPGPVIADVPVRFARPCSRDTLFALSEFHRLRERIAEELSADTLKLLHAAA